MIIRLLDISGRTELGRQLQINTSGQTYAMMLSIGSEVAKVVMSSTYTHTSINPYNQSNRITDLNLFVMT